MDTPSNYGVVVEEGRIWVRVQASMGIAELSRLVLVPRSLLEIHGYRADGFTLDGEIYLTARIERRPAPPYHA